MFLSPAQPTLDTSATLEAEGLQLCHHPLSTSPLPSHSSPSNKGMENFIFLIHLFKNHSFHPLTITHVQLFCSTQDSLGPICPPCSTARAEIASYQKETNSPTSAPRVSSLQDADKSTVGKTGVPNNYVIILPLFHQGCVCRIC